MTKMFHLIEKDLNTQNMLKIKKTIVLDYMLSNSIFFIKKKF